MLAFLIWYLSITVLGWLAFPLAYRLLTALPDRGYTLARALGLLLWGYLFWMLASLGIAQNDIGGLMLALSIVLALSAWALAGWKRNPALVAESNEGSLQGWLHRHRRLIIGWETLFFLAFAFMAWVRACDPALVGTEKPMELAFISGILRSPTFPPRDPWLAGYAISYYYFGYVMAAMLAKVSGVTGAVAHNLMTALVFALNALGASGVVYNLLVIAREKAGRTSAANGRKACGASFWLSLLGPLFLLFVSNLEGTLEVLHRRGVFWHITPDGRAASFFWSWLDLKELSEPPMQPLGWLPQRYLWWWRASRVVMDYDLAGNWKEVIDEFPAFSFVLADLHPHVLAMPFALLAIGLALNLFLGGWRGHTTLAGFWMPLAGDGLACLALTLGGLSFLNTWDILPYAALTIGAFLLRRLEEEGWGWKRLEEAATFALPLLALSLLLYLPFYVGFSSQLGGLLPNLINPTRGAHLWIMFAPLLLPLMAYCFYLLRREKRQVRWGQAFGLACALLLLLWALSWLLAWVIAQYRPDVTQGWLQEQGLSTVSQLFLAANRRRLEACGGWLTLLLFLFLLFALILPARERQPEKAGEITSEETPRSSAMAPSLPLLPASPAPFVLLLALVGGLLVLGVEFFYLRDVFGTRMNTVFKFYFQTWMLWSVAAAFVSAEMLTRLRGVGGWLYRLGWTSLLLMALVYPTLAFPSRTANFQFKNLHEAVRQARASDDWTVVRRVWTLDGAAHLDQFYPEVAAAIRWLQNAPDGILVEAVGGSYTDAYDRLSAYTGLPTVVGWITHEDQWRGNTFWERDQRFYDVRTLYETGSWEEALAILRKYHIRYVYIGPTERSAYRVNEVKFQRALTPVFQQGESVIYEVP
jgi:YYY domain-containing protein